MHRTTIGWNELFNDLAKLGDKLILNDGCKFFMSDPAERFGSPHLMFRTISYLGFLVMICLSTISFVSKVCTPHAQCWFFFRNSSCCSLDLFCSRFEVGVGHLLQEPIFLCELCLSCSPNQLHWNRMTETMEEEMTVETCRSSTFHQRNVDHVRLRRYPLSLSTPPCGDHSHRIPPNRSAVPVFSQSLQLCDNRVSSIPLLLLQSPSDNDFLHH